MSAGDHLGQYLRVRREALRPDDVGLPDTPRRRVAGLRREEVAMLAGISTEYYVRLETGRDSHPSRQVLDTLADALRLDEEARRYLRGLAAPASRQTRRRSRKSEAPPASLVALIQTWTTPAYISNRLHQVLAANPMATALLPAFRVGNNTLRSLFLDPTLREFYLDWEATAVKVVAGLRAMIDPAIDDPELAKLVGELSVRSDDFARLWSRQEVRTKGSGRSLVQHPQVGELDLCFEKLAVQGTDGQLLVIFHSEPGSATAERLLLLSSLADSSGHPRSERVLGTPDHR